MHRPPAMFAVRVLQGVLVQGRPNNQHPVKWSQTPDRFHQYALACSQNLHKPLRQKSLLSLGLQR